MSKKKPKAFPSPEVVFHQPVKETNSKEYTRIEGRTKNQGDFIKSIIHNTITLAIGQAGVGKALGMNELIYTPDGPKHNGDMVVGDIVCTPDGGTANVIGVYPQGKKPMYKVVFDDDSEVICCREHLWKVNAPYFQNSNNMIVDTDYIIKHQYQQLTINPTNPVNFTKKELILHPYVVGALLGDGNLTDIYQTRFSNTDKEILDKFQSLLPEGYILKKISETDEKCDYNIIRSDQSIKGLSNLTKAIGIHGHKSYTKFIPNEYLYTSVEDRIELLKGLMDTDGTASNHNKRADLSFTTTSKILSDQFKWLIESLGGVCNISTKTKHYTYKGNKKVGAIAYQCTIRLEDGSICFSLPRKLNRVGIRSKIHVYRRIRYVDYIGEQDAQCIMIDHPESLYLTNNFIPTHNTSLAVGTAVHLYKTERIDKIVISRPAIPVFEAIGFAPGDLNEKMMPYIMPMKKEFDKFLPKGEFEQLMKNGVIEIVPLCYLQGWNIEGILLVDECALLSYAQYSLILSRVCKDGKVVLMGDSAQDGGTGTGEALEAVVKKLDGLSGIGVVRFGPEDNQRHELVNAIQRRLLGANSRPPMTLEDRWSHDEHWGKEHLFYKADY